MPPLFFYYVQSGGLASSQLHVARSVCRRAERRAVTLVREGALKDTTISVYLNRLSDYLFVAARYAAMKTNHTEQVYKKLVGLQERKLQDKSTTATTTGGGGGGGGETK